MAAPVEPVLSGKKPEVSQEASGFLFAMALCQPVKLNFRSVPTHIYVKWSFFNGIRSGKPDDLCSGRCP
ncbi:hypothetical protein DENIT_90119 [Pseudomonas veronii]|nr:hypothetical protein DENIT_90119 [Pseudomonas veronii]